jgi:ABC-type uncharacterized transport system ATPase subunit
MRLYAGCVGRMQVSVPWETTAAKVLAKVAVHAEVCDLTVEETDIEGVVRRIYAAARPAPADTVP